MTIDTQHRGKRGRSAESNGNALIRTLRKTYGADFAKGCADDEKLTDILGRELIKVFAMRPIATKFCGAAK